MVIVSFLFHKIVRKLIYMAFFFEKNHNLINLTFTRNKTIKENFTFSSRVFLYQRSLQSVIKETTQSKITYRKSLR